MKFFAILALAVLPAVFASPVNEIPATLEKRACNANAYSACSSGCPSIASAACKTACAKATSPSCEAQCYTARLNSCRNCCNNNCTRC
ncbi:hypothetical protein TWF481_010753 [Arthrobotrys musiformis]|uniref:Uncharacterized protein n=1 Tax=Arthrobotrys musiformis TaxID=47236 RepID=A0AAV9W4G2_9PEZI